MNSIEPTDEDIYIEKPKNGLFYCVNNFLKNIFKQDKKIGELNGKWAFMLKAFLTLFLVITPTFFAWSTWVTVSIFDNNTQRVEERIYIENIIEKLQHLPPPEGCPPNSEWKRRVESLENKTELLADYARAVEKKNDENNAKVLILLESIKTKVEILLPK